MFLIISYIISGLCLLQCTQGLSSVQQDEPQMQVPVGLVQAYVGQQNVKLDCLVVTHTNQTLSWTWYLVDKKSDSQLTSDTWIKYPSLYAIEHVDIGINETSYSRCYTLVIKNTNMLNVGLYKCEATTRSDSGSGDGETVVISTRLAVFELSPEPKVLCGIAKTNVEENEISIIQCNASIGTIPAKFQIRAIYSNTPDSIGRPVNTTFNECGFNCVAVEVNITRSMDLFQCVVLHNLLPSVITNYTSRLNVHYQPKFDNMPQMLEYDTEADLKIPINVDSNPKAWIELKLWNEHELVDDITYLRKLNTAYKNNFELSIKESEIGNATHITIKAINSIGYDTHIIQLYKMKPESTENDKEEAQYYYWWVFSFLGLLVPLVVLLGLIKFFITRHKVIKVIKERSCRGPVLTNPLSAQSIV